MATPNAIARPYAQAAYEFALSRKELSQWEAMFRLGAEVVEQPLIAKALSNSRVSSQQWFKLMSDLLAPTLNASRKNFLRLLTDNRRLGAFPVILDLFKEYEE